MPFFLQSILNKYDFLKVYKILLDFVSHFKKLSQFKSYQNMLTFSILVSYIISYNFSSNNIYIASHLHVIKDSWSF
jgi:hypothetical protein